MTYKKPQLDPSDLIIQFIADYGYGTDNADNEVHLRLREFFGFSLVDIIHNPIPKFNTVNNAFWIAQHSLTTPLPLNTLIYHNVAPREDDKSVRRDNSGEMLLGVRLDNGVIIVGPNSGYSYSLVRDRIVQCFEIPVKKYLEEYKEAHKGLGTQFRSRDIFVEPAAEFHHAFKGINFSPTNLDHTDPFFQSLVELDPLDIIPKLDKPVILHIDNYGNVKTNITAHNLNDGEKIFIDVGGYSVVATVAGGAFVQEKGSLGFVPGSSGWDAQFHELFIRGQDASKEIVELSLYRGGVKHPLEPGQQLTLEIVPQVLSSANGIGVNNGREPIVAIAGGDSINEVSGIEPVVVA
jgi:S-adenosylmethionine hydrolase